jgi:hypothetical protein
MFRSLRLSSGSSYLDLAKVTIVKSSVKHVVIYYAVMWQYAFHIKFFRNASYEVTEFVLYIFNSCNEVHIS